MDSKKILVTGASGFIGSCMAHRLASRGSEIHLILRDPLRAWRLKDISGSFTAHVVDLTERENLRKLVEEISPDIIYHFATYGAYSTQKDPASAVATNILGTINLVDASMGIVSNFINVSTSSEYGRKTRPMAETDLLEPNSLYGVTKAAATMYCAHLAHESHFPATTFRIFAAYGPYEEPMRLMPSLIVPLLNGRSPSLSSPDSVRDFIFIDDILDALEKSTKTPASQGEIFNLGNGTQHRIGDVAAMVQEAIGTEIPVTWGVSSKKQLEPEMWVADMSKTKKILGWSPRHSLRDGIAKTVKWYGDNIGYYRSL